MSPPAGENSPDRRRAFSASTSRLTAILGFGEMAGLATLLVGRHLDAGREKRIMVGALGVIAASSLLALVGTLEVFAVSYVLLGIGVALYTVAGHAYLSRRVPFERRARTIGIFEVSWASALLIGAPLVALLIGWFGWRGPFVAFAVASMVVAFVVLGSKDATELPVEREGSAPERRLTVDAWIVIAASAAIGFAGLTTVVIAGTWLDNDLGVSTGGIGLVAMAFGAAELIASSSSALVADRAGPNRSARLALLTAIVGSAVMSQAGGSLAVGAVGLVLFFLGFEFAIVTSFSLVSEAMPSARGKTLAANNAIGTLSRGAASVLTGVLYESFGIAGPATASAVASAAAVVLLSIGARRSPSASTRVGRA